MWALVLNLLNKVEVRKDKQEDEEQEDEDSAMEAENSESSDASDDYLTSVISEQQSQPGSSLLSTSNPLVNFP